MSIVEAEEMDEKRGTLRSSEQTSVIFRRAELPESVQRTAENKTQGRERERERESLRRWILGARKFADKRAREREIERKREENGYLDRSVARRLADSSRARWTMICYYTEIC